MTAVAGNTAGAMAGNGVPSPAGVLEPARVAACVAEVLGDGTPVDAHTPLLDLPGFTSLVLADLVERIERELGSEFPIELILPDTFETPATVAAALRTASLAAVGPDAAGSDAAGSAAAGPGAAGSDAAAVAGGRVHDLLDAAADRAGGHPAIRAGDRVLTYAELRDRSLAAAAWLRSLGVGPGHRVVAGLGNVPETLVAMHALSRLGAVFVPVEPTTPPWSLAHVLADARPALVLGPLDEAVAAAAARPGAVAVPVERWPAELPPADGPVDGEPTVPSEVACILYTSGSTGRPRGVVCPHRAMRFAVDAIAARIRIAADDVVGCVLPLTFDYGLYQSLLATGAGATLALGSSADAGPGLLRFLAHHGVTGLPAVPSLLATLVQLTERQPARRAPLRWISNTGAALPPALAIRAAELHPGAGLYLMYGLTECKRVSVLLPEERAQRPTSVGRPLDGTRVDIVDPATGEVLAPGEVGEIVVRGPHLMAGYWGVPAGDDQRYRRWGIGGEPALFTGDRGHLDRGGYLYFDGRDDEVYKASGFRVSTVEVELAAAEVAGVRECAVLVPTDDRPATLVVTGAVTAGAVRAGLLHRLDRFKVPDRIVVLEGLPHSGNGKVDRAALAALVDAPGPGDGAGPVDAVGPGDGEEAR